LSTDNARPMDRDGVVDALVEHYAQDRIEIGEFERRVELAHQSRTREELHGLLADLPALEGTALVTSDGLASGVPGTALDPGATASEASRAGLVRWNPSPPAERQLEVAIWSARVRKGPWRPARNIRALACMGGVELDFREALFPPGETRVFAGAVMGGIEVLVPPGVRVETSGFAFMGGFDEETGGPDLPAPGPDAPVLRITGFAMMGGVDVAVRYPGESARDAKRRKRESSRRLSAGND
jgi:hypothetical protein